MGLTGREGLMWDGSFKTSVAGSWLCLVIPSVWLCIVADVLHVFFRKAPNGWLSGGSDRVVESLSNPKDQIRSPHLLQIGFLP
jgi:hypothetical protein